jgi:hypothetical protein
MEERQFNSYRRGKGIEPEARAASAPRAAPPEAVHLHKSLQPLYASRRSGRPLPPLFFSKISSVPWRTSMRTSRTSQWRTTA